MAKKTTAKAPKAEKEPVKSPTKSRFPIPPKDLPKLVLLDKKDHPEGLRVHKIRMRLYIEMGELDNVLDVCNHYTMELRDAFETASMPGWTVEFTANGVPYYSSL